MFTRKKTQKADIKIEIDNEIISETKSNKFLEVHIDNKFNLGMHVDYVSWKIQWELQFLKEPEGCSTMNVWPTCIMHLSTHISFTVIMSVVIPKQQQSVNKPIC